MIIYIIKNSINNKLYIGQTTYSLKKRFTNHSKFGKGAIGEAIRKYGSENFTIELLETCETLDKLNEREKFWIKHYNTLSPNGYNLAEGGENRIVHEETRKKQSEARKGYVMPESTKKKLSEINKGNSYKKGYKLTPEQIETRRKVAMGNTNRRGKPISETQKENMRRTVICPYCKKEGGLSGMSRWHFNNCKFKK